MLVIKKASLHDDNFDDEKILITRNYTTWLS